MRVWLCSALLLWFVAGCERMPSAPADTPAGSQPPSEPVAATAPTTNAPVAIPVSEPAPPAAAVTDVAVLKQATELKSAGNLVAGRNLLQSPADQAGGSAELLELLGQINTQIAFTPAPAPEKVDYTIQAGDSLSKIAKNHRVTVDYLKKANNLTTDLIRTGDRLRIYQGEFAVTVNKADNTLTLTDHGKFFKRYRVGTGEYSKTPVGQFKVTSRVLHPTWWRGDKDIPYGDPANILGTHWLALDIPGYGIHGTWDNNALGKQSTAGCVRLRNEDIEELYLLLPIGTPVTIRE